MKTRIRSMAGDIGVNVGIKEEKSESVNLSEEEKPKEKPPVDPEVARLLMSNDKESYDKGLRLILKKQMTAKLAKQNIDVKMLDPEYLGIENMKEELGKR